MNSWVRHTAFSVGLFAAGALVIACSSSAPDKPAPKPAAPAAPEHGRPRPHLPAGQEHVIDVRSSNGLQ